MKILNIGVPRTGSVYVSRTLSPAWPHAHHQFTGSDWSHANFANTSLAQARKQGAFIVGFVRNPFDLLVSHWSLLRRPDVMLHYFDRDLAHLDFRSYVALVTNRRHLYPQRFPLHFPLFDDQWNLVPDYLGRFETLDEDLRRIAEITGATYTPTGRVNASARQDWRAYYDEQIYELVEEAYYADLQFFGYGRDGVTDALTTFGHQPRPQSGRRQITWLDRAPRKGIC